MARILIGFITKKVKPYEDIVVAGITYYSDMYIQAGTYCEYDTRNEMIYPSHHYELTLGNVA